MKSNDPFDDIDSPVSKFNYIYEFLQGLMYVYYIKHFCVCSMYELFKRVVAAIIGMVLYLYFTNK